MLVGYSRQDGEVFSAGVTGCNRRRVADDLLCSKVNRGSGTLGRVRLAGWEGREDATGRAGVRWYSEDIGGYGQWSCASFWIQTVSRATLSGQLRGIS